MAPASCKAPRNFNNPGPNLNNNLDTRKRIQYCHYFNNNKNCPYGQSCSFSHTWSRVCNNDGECNRYLCQFQHPREEEIFLSQRNQDLKIISNRYNKAKREHVSKITLLEVKLVSDLEKMK